MGKAKTESSRRPVGRAKLESMAASVTPAEISRERDRARLAAMTPEALVAEAQKLTNSVPMPHKRKGDGKVRIHRTDKADPWFAICRATAQDAEITLAARGLLQYLLSKPPDWRTLVRAIAKEQHVGDHTVGKLIHELILTGYVRRVHVRGVLGRFGIWEYEVFPDRQPVTEEVLRNAFRDGKTR